ncbi:MAG TPA: S8 family serine peptidase [Candidatus Cloacimonetes bacterium]|nr:S8 family serine peptidase [Candidatus Cloacimonadota bacterium]
MRKLILIGCLVMAVSAMFALKFDPYYFQSKTIITAFTREAIGNDTGTIEYAMRDGVVHTGMESFDRLAIKYDIVEMKQMHPYVKVPTWNDNGVYLQNLYRVMLNSDDNIDAAVEALSKDKNVIFAELEGINRTKYTPNDPLLPQQYVHPRINSFEAWDYTQGSYEVKVAITDSGVKWNHPDLRNNIWINPAEAPGMSINWDAGTISGGDNLDAGEGGGKRDDLIGWDFYDNDNNPIQTFAGNNHGTHVAGCAGAVGDNEIGVVGTCPIVSIISCKGAPSNSPSTGIAYGYDQIKYAAEIRADIINASWGGPGAGAYPNSIVNYATALGSLVVTAAGNDNKEHDSSYQDYPADCVQALCVASTGQGDVKSNFSDYGAPIDICAPGEGILSTIILNNGYEALSGTSMASPNVAGVAALVKSMNPDLEPMQLMQRLMNTSDYIYDKNPAYMNLLGMGRVNAFAAVMYDKIPNISVKDTKIEEIEGDGDGVPNPGEKIRLKVSLENYMNPMTGLEWRTAENLTATLSTNYQGINITQAEASFGSLTAGSTLWNNSTPFIFEAAANLPSEPIPFELNLSANLDSDFPYERTVPFTVSLSNHQAGWPIETGGASNSSPILWNMDNDPEPEMIVSDHLGNVLVLKKDGRTQVSGFPLNLGANVIGSIAMTPYGNNGQIGFAASLQNNNIAFFGGNGQIIFNVPAGGPLRSGPVITSLGQNSNYQIVCATQSGSVVALDTQGNPIPNFPVSVGGAILAPPAIADLNNDGHHEIIVSTLNGKLHALDSRTGENISGFPVTMAGGTQNPITIANLDNDAYPEIIVATSSAGKVLAYKHDGSLHFSKDVDGAIRGGAVMADVNSSGSKKIVVVSNSGKVYFLNPDGSDMPNTPVNANCTVESSPVVATFDGDRYAGVIFGDTNGFLHSVRADGTESPNFPIPIGGNLKVSAALGDVDFDNDIDIVVPTDRGFTVIDIKRGAQSYEWPCFMGTYNRAGNIVQPTNEDDPVVPVFDTALNGNYPNPFNPNTTISFSLKHKAQVNLTIYNQRGQKVRELIDEIMPAGNHHLTWNGTDDNGKGVSSGVYFYKMQSDNYTSTRKMIMMK